jgi:hypothetical protein
MAGSPSYAARWAFTTVGGSWSSAPRFDFKTDSVLKTSPILMGQGLRGIRARQAVQTRQGPYTVGGTLTADPSPQLLSYMLQWAMGGGTSTAPAFADALALRDVLIDRTGDIYDASGVAINRLTISGRSGQLLDFSIDVVGKTFDSGASWSGPAALGTNLSYQPLQHADFAATLANGEVTAAVEDFTLVIDNAATPKWRNSLVATEITPGASRGVRFTATSIASSAEVGSFIGLSGDADSGASMTLTNGTVSVTITFANLVYTERSPLPQGDEFMLAVEADVLGTSAGNEFTCAIDLTP